MLTGLCFTVSIISFVIFSCVVFDLFDNGCSGWFQPTVTRMYDDCTQAIRRIYKDYTSATVTCEHEFEHWVDMPEDKQECHCSKCMYRLKRKV